MEPNHPHTGAGEVKNSNNESLLRVQSTTKQAKRGRGRPVFLAKHASSVSIPIMRRESDYFGKILKTNSAAPFTDAHHLV